MSSNSSNPCVPTKSHPIHYKGPSLTVLPGPLALEATLNSGQVFHWSAQPDGSWAGVVGTMPARVSESDGDLVVHEGDPVRLADYFALDHPLEEIYAAFPPDPMSQASLSSCRGIRILRQPRWECVATFITSSMKQVAHIRSMSLEIRRRFGSAVSGGPTNAYPDPARLAQVNERDLRDCGLGYRAGNLLKTARLIDDGGVDLDGIAAQSTPVLRKTLQTLPGVGVKVANCILLFAYERLDAVPIDVWIHRILLKMRRGRDGTPAQLARYARRRLGPCAGYVQQYLFHQFRTTRRGTSPH